MRSSPTIRRTQSSKVEAGRKGDAQCKGSDQVDSSELRAKEDEEHATFKAKENIESLVKAKTELRAKEEVTLKVKEDELNVKAELRAKEEAALKAKGDIERLAKSKAELRAREAVELKVKEDIEHLAKEEVECRASQSRTTKEDARQTQLFMLTPTRETEGAGENDRRRSDEIAPEHGVVDSPVMEEASIKDKAVMDLQKLEEQHK